MPKYIALLRGINVGKAKRIAMADLRAVVAGLGFDDVTTLLNSGNVVFTGVKKGPAAVAQELRQAIHKQLDVDAPVVVLSDTELAVIVEADPHAAVAIEPARRLVVFVQDARLLAKLAAITGKDWSPEQIALGKRAAYMCCPGGIHKSKLAASVAAQLGDAHTMRNWQTVLKLSNR